MMAERSPAYKLPVLASPSAEGSENCPYEFGWGDLLSDAGRRDRLNDLACLNTFIGKLCRLRGARSNEKLRCKS